MNSNYILILGSKSPRRQELLKQAGLKFRVTGLNSDESYPEHFSPKRVALYLAEKKSAHYSKKLKIRELLITADTIVTLHDKILGKPGDTNEAVAMLKKLSGKEHQVITGVCLRSAEKKLCFTDLTKVEFRKLSQEEIVYYVKKFKPFDKAGAYGIQEWIGMVGITSIQGSYYNVVGLPVQKLIKAIDSF